MTDIIRKDIKAPEIVEAVAFHPSKYKELWTLAIIFENMEFQVVYDWVIKGQYATQADAEAALAEIPYVKRAVLVRMLLPTVWMDRA